LRTRDHRVCFDGVPAIRQHIRSNLLERRQMKRTRRSEIDTEPAVSQASSVVSISDGGHRVDRVIAA
jgi:hypothetical protein